MMTTDTRRNLSTRSAPMMSIDWADIRDAFQRFTDPASAADLLRSCLPELSAGAWKLDTVTVGDTKFKTYRKPSSKIKSTLSVCYHATVNKRETEGSSAHVFYIKAFLGGRSGMAFRDYLRERSTHIPIQEPVHHVPEHDMIIWRFPEDPCLPHLSQLHDLQTVGQHLPFEGLARIGIKGMQQVMSCQVVNYRPEIRCTNRYELYDPNDDCHYRLFGKTFENTAGQRLHERLHLFWNRHLSDPNAMAIAQPLGYSEAVRTVWQLGAPGAPLAVVLNPSNYQQYAEAISNGLTSLHTSPIAGLATHSPTDHLVEIRKKLTKLSDAIPMFENRLESLAEVVNQTAPPASAIPFCPIHWDFHANQLLASEGRLVFCDLDELVIGDPAQDLANFIVDLHFRNCDRSLIYLIARELCRTYRQRVSWEIPVDRLVWHARIQLINKAYRQYLRFAPGFEQTVEQIIRMAEGDLTLW
ncbi:MAG: aminoglycoside phosphotransferase family protein [Nitrospira sp.]|nr:aminoglycoside phosphotransferase family protein [Nitrospira sp.]MDR4468115.1 aminoglycoside phosphotransferase family protein [Nitrospira sp.]